MEMLNKIIDRYLEKDFGRNSLVMPSVKRALSGWNLSPADAQKFLSSKMLLDANESADIMYDILKRGGGETFVFLEQKAAEAISSAARGMDYQFMYQHGGRAVVLDTSPNYSRVGNEIYVHVTQQDTPESIIKAILREIVV